MATSGVFNEINAIVEGATHESHLALFADTMMCDGVPKAFTRFGMRARGEGPLACGLFETFTSVMVAAAGTGAKDDIVSFLSHIMAGRNPPSGTTARSLVYDMGGCNA